MFTTVNYGLVTTPLKEYEISTGQRACPALEMLDKKGRHVCVIWKIKELRRLKLSSKRALPTTKFMLWCVPLLFPFAPPVRHILFSTFYVLNKCAVQHILFSAQVEYLWQAYSYIESSGLPYTVEGGGGLLAMVPVLINANGKALTVEELHTQKKDMHLAAFRHLLAEPARHLEHIAED